MRRIFVIGCPGAGKTTVARAVAARLDIRHIELDSIAQQAGWVEMPAGQLRQRVTEALQIDGWILDGNYTSRLAGLHYEQADTVIFLDLPKRVVMWRVVWRTLRRFVTRRRYATARGATWRSTTSAGRRRWTAGWTASGLRPRTYRSAMRW